MSLSIEDYALISDCRTGALVGRNGSIDWLCLPRYDCASVFGALLGDEEHGQWSIAPTDPQATSTRAYVDRTFVLVTHWVTATGELEVVDFMPHGDRRSNLVRRVRCVRGQVEVVEELRMRFGYATALPWVRQVGSRRCAGRDRRAGRARDGAGPSSSPASGITPPPTPCTTARPSTSR